MQTLHVGLAFPHLDALKKGTEQVFSYTVE